MTTSTLGDPILLPDPHIPPVTAHCTAVDHTPSLIGHMASITGLSPGAGVLSPPASGGGWLGGCPPGGGGGLDLTSTCHLQVWILIPVIDLSISPSVELPGLYQVMRTKGISHVDDSSHIDQGLITYIPDCWVVHIVQVLVMLMVVIHRSSIRRIILVTKDSQPDPLIVHSVSSRGHSHCATTTGL